MFYAPSFNNEYIFGIDVVMVTVDPPRDVQVNAFNGVNGVEIIDHGSRQRYTAVSGRFLMPDVPSLVAAENALRSYRDPFEYTLITTDGSVYEGVKLESFEPQPRIFTDGATGYVWRTYRARFIHTI
jgi:phosphohistidine swiveling domain-containing protein